MTIKIVQVQFYLQDRALRTAHTELTNYRILAIQFEGASQSRVASNYHGCGWTLA